MKAKWWLIWYEDMDEDGEVSERVAGICYGTEDSVVRKCSLLADEENRLHPELDIARKTVCRYEPVRAL